MRHIFFIIVWISGIYGLNAQEMTGREEPRDRIIKIGKIHITGNQRTKAGIILRELDFKEGQELLWEEFNEMVVFSQQKLINTRLFLSADIVPLMMTDTEADVLIRLQERWYIFPVPIFRLADRNFTEWWVNQKRDFSRVNYGIQVFHFNLTGRNDRLAVTTQFGFTRNYQLRYQIPYINRKQTLGLTFSTGFANNKAVGYTTRNHRLQFVESESVIRKRYLSSASLTFRPSFYSRHTLNLAYARTSIDDTVSTLNPDYLLKGQSLQRYFRLSYIYSWDNRDYFAYPLSGKLYRVELNRFGWGLYNDIRLFSVRASWSRYVELGKGFYLANSLRGYYSPSRDIPYFQRVGFGYRPDFIRGYERYVIEGDAFLSNRSSLKLRLLSGVKQLYRSSKIPQFQHMPYAFYLKAFLDMGFMGEPLPAVEGSFLNQTLLVGGGIGLDVVTYYDFVVRFEFTLNKEGQTGFFVNFRSAL